MSNLEEERAFHYSERTKYTPRGRFDRKITGVHRVDDVKCELWLKLDCGHSWKSDPSSYGPFGPLGTLHNGDEVHCQECLISYGQGLWDDEFGYV